MEKLQVMQCLSEEGLKHFDASYENHIKLKMAFELGKMIIDKYSKQDFRFWYHRAGSFQALESRDDKLMLEQGYRFDRLDIIYTVYVQQLKGNKNE